jgi:hypothetical protein
VVVGEVVVQRLLGNPQLGGDIVQVRAAEAALSHLFSGHREDPITGDRFDLWPTRQGSPVSCRPSCRLSRLAAGSATADAVRHCIVRSRAVRTHIAMQHRALTEPFRLDILLSFRDSGWLDLSQAPVIEVMKVAGLAEAADRDSRRLK